MRWPWQGDGVKVEESQRLADAAVRLADAAEEALTRLDAFVVAEEARRTKRKGEGGHHGRAQEGDPPAPRPGRGAAP